MTRKERGIAFMVLSLLLYNAHYVIALLEGDLLKSVLLLLSIVAGTACLGAGVWLLARDRRDRS